MSHYTVAVITKPGQSYEELLEPFDESIEVSPYVNSTKEDIVLFERERCTRLKEHMAEYKADPKKWESENNVYWINKSTNKIDPVWKKVLDLENMSDEEVYKAYREYLDDEDFDEDGNELSTYNPKSKWDWYELGGRWDGSLLTTNGEKVNECTLKELDASQDMKCYEESKRWWEVAIEGSPLKRGEKKSDFDTWYKKEYYVETYKDKETYANCMSRFHQYSVLTPEGEWFEAGKMGWFGVSLAENDAIREWQLHFKENFIDKYPSDYEIHLVDCHI